MGGGTLNTREAKLKEHTLFLFFFFLAKKTSANVLLSPFSSWICFVHIRRKSVSCVCFAKRQMLLLVATIFSIKFENNYRVFTAATLCLWDWEGMPHPAQLCCSLYCPSATMEGCDGRIRSIRFLQHKQYLSGGIDPSLVLLFSWDLLSIRRKSPDFFCVSVA